MKHKTIRPIAALLVLALCVLLAGCGAESADAVPVQAVSDILGRGALGMTNRFAGVTVAGKSENVNPAAGMTVAELKVAVGDRVEIGDVLFLYDTEAGEIALQQAELELENLQNSITGNDNQIAELEKRLAATTVSSEQLTITLEIQSLQTQNRETEYNIKLKQAEIERQRTALTETEFYSPASGTVTSVNESGQTDNYGNPLPYLVISEMDNLRVKGTVNELNLSSVYPGAEVTMIKLAPMGDPMELRLHGYELTLERRRGLHRL